MTWRPVHPESLYQEIWLAYKSNDQEKLHELLDIPLPNGKIGSRHILLWHARRKYDPTLRGKYKHLGRGGWIRRA